jgi:hypothetical protein
MAEQRWIFNHLDPPVSSGTTLKVKPDQTLTDQTQNVDELQLSGNKPVSLHVDGPRFALTPEDIAGVYPAPGSEDSPDEYLPHIALRRRTLPWERPGPSGYEPWLALLLLKQSELQGNSAASAIKPRSVASLETLDPVTFDKLQALKTPAATEANMVLVDAKLLQQVLPRVKPSSTPSNSLLETGLLCHVKRTSTAGVEEDTAIVVANRLPDASQGMAHTALLVSLERREDIYTRTSGNVALIVLHHWTFTPSTGGDFEQVMKAIAIRPNGGVLRFGNLAEDAPAAVPLSGGFDALLDHDGFALDPLDHTQPTDAVYRGPLRPFPAPARGKGFAIRAAPEEFVAAGAQDAHDYSHAAAFELGRLLAVNDPGIQDDLREVRLQLPHFVEEKAIDPLPDVLKIPEWVMDPAWAEQPWSMVKDGIEKSLVSTHAELLDLAGTADVTGVAEQVATIGKDVGDVIGKLGTPVATQPTYIDIATTTDAKLQAQLPKNLPELKGLGGG